MGSTTSIRDREPPGDSVHEFVRAVVAGEEARLEAAAGGLHVPSAGSLQLSLRCKAGQMHVRLTGDLELDTVLPAKEGGSRLVIGSGRRNVDMSSLRIELRASVVHVETSARDWYLHPPGALTFALRDDNWLDFARFALAAELPTSLRVDCRSVDVTQRLKWALSAMVGNDRPHVEYRCAEDPVPPLQHDVMDQSYSHEGDYVVAGNRFEVSVFPVWRDATASAAEQYQSADGGDVAVAPGPANRNWWAVVLLAIARATDDTALVRRLRARAGV